MKTLNGFLRQLRSRPVFTGYFSSTEEVEYHFCEKFDEDVRVCYASYECEFYEGYAFVIFYDKRTKKYYEVNASHCSCYGLEEQWLPEEISVEGLSLRLEKGYLYDGNVFRNLLKKYVG